MNEEAGLWCACCSCAWAVAVLCCDEPLQMRSACADVLLLPCANGQHHTKHKPTHKA